MKYCGRGGAHLAIPVLGVGGWRMMGLQGWAMSEDLVSRHEKMKGKTLWG
jgi:hypothetical protein